MNVILFYLAGVLAVMLCGIGIALAAKGNPTAAGILVIAANTISLILLLLAVA